MQSIIPPSLGSGINDSVYLVVLSYSCTCTSIGTPSTPEYDVVPVIVLRANNFVFFPTLIMENGVTREQLTEPLISSSEEENKDIVIVRFWNPFTLEPIRVNHNVLLNWIVAAVYGCADSLWTGTVIAAYLKNLAGEKNTPVGMIEACSGLASLLSALPVGYLADKIGRDPVIRTGGVLMMLTAALHIGLIVWIGNDPSKFSTGLTLTAIVMGFWGISGGVVNGPAQALYADSIPTGQRSFYYTVLVVIYLVASAVGPTTAIVLFQTVGDQWDLHHLQLVLYVGLGLSLVNSVFMLLFDDKKALTEAAATTNESPAVEQGAPEETTQEAAETVPANRNTWIPYILFTHSLVMATGSGMTVKFFPLFFKDDVGMSPSQVQGIYVAVPLVMAVFGVFCTKTARVLGRVTTNVVFVAAGISLLVSMVLFKGFLDKHPVIIVPIYILRTALMNCVYPIQESIMMDSVPPSSRARWKSLESVAVFGWCGSAWLGGYWADKYDYTTTFGITATIQGCGVLVLALLWVVAPHVEQEGPSERAAEDPVEDALENGGDGVEERFFDAVPADSEETNGESSHAEYQDTKS